MKVEYSTCSNMELGCPTFAFNVFFNVNLEKTNIPKMPAYYLKKSVQYLSSPLHQEFDPSG
jgi:hypothetical protein